MWEGECPEFWGGAEEVEKALAGARGNLGAIGDTDKVCVAVVAVFAVQVFAGGDDEGLDAVPGL